MKLLPFEMTVEQRNKRYEDYLIYVRRKRSEAVAAGDLCEGQTGETQNIYLDFDICSFDIGRPGTGAAL